MFAVLGFRRRLSSSLSTVQHSFCRKDKDPQRSIQVPNVLVNLKEQQAHVTTTVCCISAQKPTTEGHVAASVFTFMRGADGLQSDVSVMTFIMRKAL